MSTFDQIWTRVVKILGFLGGMGIMYYETLKDHTDRPYLYAAALMMMGLQIAEIVEKVTHGLGGGTAKLPSKNEETRPE